jgi:hypothetical protein
MLTFRDPYLRLGPFLLEHRNKAGNYIAQVSKQNEIYLAKVHGLLSEHEMKEVRMKTTGWMKATPYAVSKAGDESSGVDLDFSYDRTSKVHYLSERTDDLMAQISRRMELATGFRVFKPTYNYTSENYQIMNYGLGGKIGLHLDEGEKVSQR